MSRSLAKLALEMKDEIKEKFLFNRDLGIETCINLLDSYMLNSPSRYKQHIKCSVKLVISLDKKCHILYESDDGIYQQGFNNKKFTCFLNKKIR